MRWRSAVNTKIRPVHLQRRAYIYLRQSSPGQVEFHRESTERQYALAERAVGLGWDRSQIQILDKDLGKSGTTTEHRSDFLALMAAVGIGEAGAVFALEISRFSRSQADWHKLLDVCALTDTLVIDHEGIYDPNDFNDRVVLGFKGTWSHTELHGMRLRLNGAKINKAKKGKLRCRPPVGYVYDINGDLVFDPDESVVASVRLIFQKFLETGSALGVARYFAEHGLSFPRREWLSGGDGRLFWSELFNTRVLSVLNNPTYAGVYVYGRSRGKNRIVEGKIWKGRELVRNRDEWLVKIMNAHPPYISWDNYLENKKILSTNRLDHDVDGRRGVARKGSTLLQGLVICGKCGGRMNPHYFHKPSQPPVYICSRRRQSFGMSTCWVVPASRVDRAIENYLLDALSRENIDLSLAVLAEIEKNAAAEDQHWQIRIERAQIDAERAQRQFDRVEPENRLVARNLEHRWNETLALLESLNQEYQRVREKKPLQLSNAQRIQVMALTKDFPKIWKSATTTVRDRKELLGLLVKQVALAPVDIPERQVKIDVLWHTGATTVLYAPRPRNARATKTPDNVIEIVRKLAPSQHDREIATELNRLGLRTGRQRAFTAASITHIRYTYRIAKPGSDPAVAAKGTYMEGRYLSTSAAAKRLGVGIQTIGYWRSIGVLSGHRETPRGPWWYEINEEVIKKLKDRIEKNHRNHRDARHKSVSINSTGE
jgi:DNA invertase Pin-like site-specific DNA recombinase